MVPDWNCVKTSLQPKVERCYIKTNFWRCRVDTKFGTFSSRFSAQPPLSQNSNLNCFLCYFLANLSTNFNGFEHTKTLPFFFLVPASCERFSRIVYLTVLLYDTSYFRWNRVFSLADTRHVPVRKFPYWIGPDYEFRQPFCLQKNKALKSLKNLTDLVN